MVVPVSHVLAVSPPKCMKSLLHVVSPVLHQLCLFYAPLTHTHARTHAPTHATNATHATHSAPHLCVSTSCGCLCRYPLRIHVFMSGDFRADARTLQHPQADRTTADQVVSSRRGCRGDIHVDIDPRGRCVDSGVASVQSDWFYWILLWPF